MFKPLSNRVFIEPIANQKTTASGIVLPDTAEKQPVEGKVIATGPGRLNDKGERIPMSVQVGDTVLFREYGSEVEYQGKKYQIREEDDILAVLENN